MRRISHLFGQRICCSSRYRRSHRQAHFEAQEKAQTSSSPVSPQACLNPILNQYCGSLRRFRLLLKINRLQHRSLASLAPTESGAPQGSSKDFLKRPERTWQSLRRFSRNDLAFCEPQALQKALDEKLPLGERLHSGASEHGAQISLHWGPRV